MLHLSTPPQPSSRSSPQTRFCASASSSCLCPSCASLPPPTANSSSKLPSKQHNDRPSQKPHFFIPHTQGCHGDGTTGAPFNGVEGYSIELHQLQGRGHPLNGKKNIYSPPTALWPELIQLEPMAAGSLSDLLAVHSPPSTPIATAGPWPATHNCPDDAVDGVAAHRPPAPWSTPRNLAGGRQERTHCCQQHGHARGHHQQQSPADAQSSFQSQGNRRQRHSSSSFLVPLSKTGSNSINTNRRSFRTNERLISSFSVSRRKGASMMAKPRPYHYLVARSERFSQKSMVPRLTTTTATRPRTTSGVVRSTAPSVSLSSFIPAVGCSPPTRCSPAFSTHSPPDIVPKSMVASTDTSSPLPSSCSTPTFESLSILGPSSCPASTVLPCGEGAIIDRCMEEDQKNRERRIACSSLPLVRSKDSSHAALLPPSSATHTFHLSGDACTFSDVTPSPSLAPTIATTACPNINGHSLSGFVEDKIDVNTTTLSYSTSLPTTSSDMMRLSKRDIGTRVRDENDEEEELLNVGCETASAIIHEPMDLGKVVGTTGMASRRSGNRPPASETPSSKQRQRCQSMVFERPLCSDCHRKTQIPASLESYMPCSEAAGQVLPQQHQQQDVRRAGPMRVASASGYLPNILASSSFPPSPPGTHRCPPNTATPTATPTVRSSFFFSPRDMSTDTSSGSEEESEEESEEDESWPTQRQPSSERYSLHDPFHFHPQPPIPPTPSTSRLRRGHCLSASMAKPLSEASMSSLHAAFSSSLSMSTLSDSVSTLAESMASTTTASLFSDKPPQESPLSNPAILPFSTMVDLAAAKAENITGLYFAKQMNANLRRSLPYLRCTSSQSILIPPTPSKGEEEISVSADAKGVQSNDNTKDSPPGSPLTPVPGPSPEATRRFTFATSVTTPSSNPILSLSGEFSSTNPSTPVHQGETSFGLEAASPAVHIQITSPSPIQPRTPATTGSGSSTPQRTKATKPAKRVFDQGHPVEMNTFAPSDTANPFSRAAANVQQQQRCSLPPLPPSQLSGTPAAEWDDARVNHHEQGDIGDSRAGLRRARTVTCSGSIDGMARGSTTNDQRGWPSFSSSLPSASSMSSLSTSPVDKDISVLSSSSPSSRPPPPPRSQHRRHHSASHFFHLSSLRQHSPAQFNLALCYEHGQGGVDQDLGKAIRLYQQAAAQGHAKASYNLGCICVHYGQVHKAIGWFEWASKCRVRDYEMIQKVATAAEEEQQYYEKQRQAVENAEDKPKKAVEVVVCPPCKAEYLASLSSHVPVTASSESRLLESLPSSTTKSMTASATTATPLARLHSTDRSQDLFDLLHGTSAVERATVAGSGPTAPYLPAMLTLALLCRRGVTVADGGRGSHQGQEQQWQVYLQRDGEQAIRVLQKLIAMATPLSSVNDNIHNNNGDAAGSCQQHPLVTDTPFPMRDRNDCVTSRSSSRPRDDASPLAHRHSAAAYGADSVPYFSTSCPNHTMQPPPPPTVPLANQDISCPTGNTAASGSVREYEKDQSEPIIPTQQGNQRSTRRQQQLSSMAASLGHRHLPERSSKEKKRARLPSMPPTTEDHEAWAVTLARHLLNHWQQQDAQRHAPPSYVSPTSAAAAAAEERIQRYHLLHMTNPSDGKTLYNLGLVYDTYLGLPAVASRCYLSAYEKSLVVLEGDGTESGGSNEASSFCSPSTTTAGKAVTRINSAWNLGVLYAKDGQWAVARDWFLRARQELASIMQSPPSSWHDADNSRSSREKKKAEEEQMKLLLVVENQHYHPELRTDTERLDAVLAMVDRQLANAGVSI